MMPYQELMLGEKTPFKDKSYLNRGWGISTEGGRHYLYTDGRIRRTATANKRDMESDEEYTAFWPTEEACEKFYTNWRYFNS